MQAEKFDMSEGYYTEDDAALIIGVSTDTLQFWRLREEADGPPFLIDAVDGAIYPENRLRRWIRDLQTNRGVPMLPPLGPLILH